MNKQLLFFALVLSSLGCNNDKDIRVVKKIKIDNRILEAYLINDSIIDGKAKFYTSSGNLETVTTFQNGKKNGLSINYYPNGKKWDSSFYYHDLRNGPHYVFDSINNLLYQDYYYFGKSIGGKNSFKNGMLASYSFENFENTVLFNCSYDSSGAMSRFGGEILNTNTYISNKDNTPATGIFSYFIYPPTVEISYSLGMINEKSNSKKEIMVFNKNLFFIDTVLPKLKNDWNYYIAADYNDTLNKFHKYYITVLQ